MTPTVLFTFLFLAEDQYEYEKGAIGKDAPE